LLQINAAKNYQEIFNFPFILRYCKGGDYRSREANVHRLAEVSVNILDQYKVCHWHENTVDYLITVLLEGHSKNILCQRKTGQQLLLGAYSAMNRQIGRGIKIMQDLVVIVVERNYRS
jgi:succinate dehydrogenase / fumarate reductase flavoprotein subunit